MDIVRNVSNCLFVNVRFLLDMMVETKREGLGFVNKTNAKWLLWPGVIIVLLALFYPLLAVLLLTLKQPTGYVQFLTNSYNLTVISRTLWIAVVVMVITLVLGLTLSLWISRQRAHRRQLLLLIVLFPTLTNAVVRNFAWIIILGKDGVLNRTLLGLHLIHAPLTLLYTNTAIIIGSVYLFLPIMVTTLSGSVNALNPEIEEAASVLGARPWTVLTRIIIPQLRVGLMTGAILVFAGTMTAYTTPQLLGGNQHLVMSTLIYQQALTLGDWNSAGVVAMVLIVMAATIMAIMNFATKRMDRRA